MYETGAMRRTHLRHHDNIIKRLLIHGCAFNLGLAMRKLTGYGTPRGLHESLNVLNLLISALRVLWMAFRRPWPIKIQQEYRCFV